jgi:anti-sigma factor ChrR (cupin superfamily)
MPIFGSAQLHGPETWTGNPAHRQPYGVSVFTSTDRWKPALSHRPYDPGAESPHHTHPGGEEVFVLGGGFEDEFGAYPART